LGAVLNTGGYNLSVAGTADFSGATLNAFNAGTLSFSSSLTLGTLSNPIGSTFTFNGASQQNIYPNGNTLDTVTISGSDVRWTGTSTVGAVTITGKLTLDSSIAPGAVTLNVKSGKTVTNSGTFALNSSGGALALQGSGGAFTFSGTGIIWGTSTIAVGNITYSPAVSLTTAATINLNAASTFGTITLSSGGPNFAVGTNTLTSGAITVSSGTLSVAGGSGSISAGANALVVSGGTLRFITANGSAIGCGNFTESSGTVSNDYANTITASGSVVITGGTFSTQANSTIAMTGTAKTINASLQLGNLTIGNLASVTVTVSPLSLAGNLAVNGPGATSFSNGGAALGIMVAGNWTVATSASYTAGTGTVTLSGSGASVTSGGSGFYNLTVSGTATSADATNVTHNLDVTGTFTLGAYKLTVTNLIYGTGTLDGTNGAGVPAISAGSMGTTGFQLAVLDAPNGVNAIGVSGAPGDWNVGTYAMNADTVTFTTAGTIYSGTTFNNLTSSAGVRQLGGVDITVDAALNVSGGSLQDNGRQITADGNATLTAASALTGTMALDGTAAQTITANGVTFNALSVTKTGGTATTAGGATGSFTAATYVQSGAGGTFSVTSGATMTVTTSATVSAGTLGLTGVYSGSAAPFAVGSAAGAVTVGSSIFRTAAMTVSTGGSFAQSGNNGGSAQTVASLTVSGGTCIWDSGNSGGSMTITGAINLTAGALGLGIKTLAVATLNISGGALDLGSAIINVSSLNNTVSPTTCADTVSVINLAGASGTLVLNTPGNSTIGTLNINANTTLDGALGGAAGTVKALSIANAKTLSLDSTAGAITLDLGTATSSGSVLVGTGALIKVSNSTNTITLAALYPAHPFSYAGADIGYNGQALTINDMNASALNTTIGGGANITLGGNDSFLSVTLSGASTLNLASGNLSCGAFTNNNTTAAINNTGPNTITSSGTVVISSSFGTPANSTLVMTGAGTNLNATPQIGNLTVSGSVTLQAALSMAGTMTISGTLNDATSNSPITLGGDWSNTGTFSSGTCTVKFTNSSLNVSGANHWYVFDYEVAGGIMYFQESRTQTITAGGSFIVKTAGTNPQITLTRQDADQTGLVDWPIGSPPNPTAMWQIDVLPTAHIDMSNVLVKYSDARAHPIAQQANVTLFTSSLSQDGYNSETCYQWLSGIEVIYSYIEDSDGNGKVDRIRVVAQTTLNGIFTGFSATVNGYAIDTSKGAKGFMMVPHGSTLPSGYGGDGFEFFIYLVEKSYNDTGAAPSWSITANTTLKDDGTKTLKLNTFNGIATATIDEAAPRIAYTLALPGKQQVFFHFSEPVYADTSGTTAISAANFSGATSVARISSSGNGTSEALVTYGAPIAAADIAAASTVYSLSGPIYEAPQTIINYATDPAWVTFFTAGLPPAPYNNSNPTTQTGPGAWPTPIASLTHRVSDLMVDIPPPASGAYDPSSYFAWPIYAKDQLQLSLSDSQIANLSAAQSAAEGIGLIRAFDGTQWLRPQTVTVQAKVSAALGAAQPSIFYDTNVASTYKGSSGLWLPTHAETAFSGLDAYPNAAAGSQNDAVSISSGLWNIAVPGTDAKIKGMANNSVFDFFLSLSTAPSNLYVARLDAASGGSIPSDWYRHVRPFSFFFHNIVLQRGGATVLNNVIDPTKGETVRLSYQLGSAGSVTVTVFTLDGDIVARLANASSQAAGDHAVYWDGRNLAGNAVARGLYFVRIVAPGMDEIRKVLVVRK
jgi:hypothetical protein